MDYKSLNECRDKDLTKWIALLNKFNGSYPLSREIIMGIEDFFEYYWENNP